MLTAARALLAEEGRWTQGVLARDAMGAEVEWWSKWAVRFCAMGALHRAAPDAESGYQAERLLLAAMPPDRTLPGINDGAESVDEVLALFDRAIAEAQP